MMAKVSTKKQKIKNTKTKKEKLEQRTITKIVSFCSKIKQTVRKNPFTWYVNSAIN